MKGVMVLIKNNKLKAKITLLICILISFIVVTLIVINNKQESIVYFSETYQNDINKKANEVEEKTKDIENEQTKDIEKEQTIWQIEIPSINLNANIDEGTTTEILNEFIGHFSNTSTKEGNIGLAAHNRGYPVNYFKDIKNLKIGDEIIYKYGDYQAIYEVKEQLIIDDTDWSFLEETEDNRITLITCVENDSAHRRCVQAIEKLK